MNLRKEIRTGQLFCLLIVCRLSVALTFPFDSVGSFNNQEWFAAVLFFPILLSVMSFLLFFYNKTGLCPADAAAKTSPFFGKAVSLVFSVFFLLSAAVNLSRFNIFMTSTTGADQSPLFFPLLLIIPSVYAAYKGIEAISRTACIILVIGLVSAAVIILAVIPKFDMLNVLPPRSSDRKNVARLLMTYFSGTSEAALNLDISLRLRDLLRLCGVRVSMIRETDTAVYSDGCRTISEKKVSDIKNRTETVNQTENALLLSVHQNFFTEGKYHGAQVFYAKTPGSQALAEQLQANLALGLEPGNRRQCKKSDGVYLMEHIGCTGVLVECGFLSNYEEEQRLLQPEYQKKLASVIAGTLTVSLSEEHPTDI